MPVNARLSVRVSDGSTDRSVTGYVSNLGFTKVAPGGHQACRFRMNLPQATFGDLGPQDKCWIYDKRGRTVFGAAYMENPTPVDGLTGQAFDIAAMGGMALANDESRPLVYITRDMGGWIATPGLSASASIETGEWGDDGTLQRVRTKFGGGSVLATGTVARADYVGFDDTDTEMAGYGLPFILSGKNDASYTLDILNANGTIVSGAMQVTDVASSQFLAAGGGRLAVQLRRSGAPTNVADDTTATDWVDFSAIGRRVDRYGTALTGADLVSVTQVLASQVAEDLLGRLLTFCDPAISTIDETAFGIDQLAYADGVKAATVLTDLAQWEPDYWWGIHESGDDDRHRFSYQAWATEPRYVVSVRDGWRQTGSDSDLCNRIVVYYTDAAGKQQHVEVTADDLGLTVEALGSRTKDAEPITLPAGRGSAANAAQIGAAVLRDKINPPLAGQVTVRRPIVDLWTGHEVMPWELEPGCPVMVREPGYSIRCTQMDYDDAAVASTLTLGRPPLTNEQRLARLARVA